MLKHSPAAQACLSMFERHENITWAGFGPLGHAGWHGKGERRELREKTVLLSIFIWWLGGERYLQLSYNGIFGYSETPPLLRGKSRDVSGGQTYSGDPFRPTCVVHNLSMQESSRAYLLFEGLEVWPSNRTAYYLGILPKCVLYKLLIIHSSCPNYPQHMHPISWPGSGV